MEAGDLIIFNNTEPHGWIGTEEDMHLLVMIFQPEFVSDKLDVSGEDICVHLQSAAVTFKTGSDTRTKKRTEFEGSCGRYKKKNRKKKLDTGK